MSVNVPDAPDCHSERSEEPGLVAKEGTRYADDLYCPECGYSLRGLTSIRCPECGLSLDFIESAESLIPWERRRELGRFRTYWRTAWLATFRPKRFCRAAYQPVSYRDAQVFRWISIAHAIAALLLPIATVELLSGNTLLEEAVEETGWWFVVFVGLCVPLALAALTGIPSYFFHPRYLPIERQNRAVALSYYGCAALAFAFPLMLLVLTSIWVYFILAIAPQEVPRDVLIGICVVSVLVPAILGVLACWVCWSRLARYLLQRTGRRLAVTWLMPLLSLVVCGLALIGLPLVVYGLAVVFYSVRGGGLGG